MKKVIGIGNALVDIMTILPDEKILEQFNLPKGSMQLVDTELIRKLTEATEKYEKKITSGGSAANTIYGLAKMGVSSTYIGCLGDDVFGNHFLNDMKNSGADIIAFKGKNESGRAIALVTPDSERTFAVYLGAAIELSAKHLKKEYFEGYDYLHIEGYLMQNHELIETAINMAKEVDCKVSLDFASYNVVQENLNFLKHLISKVDILFANEEEAKAFTGKEPELALDEIGNICDIVIIKLGKKGSIVKNKDNKYKIDALDANCVDTTGAGDLYASGFLYGLVKGYSLEKCGYIGTVLASKTIEVIGAKMDDERWNKAKMMI